MAKFSEFKQISAQTLSVRLALFLSLTLLFVMGAGVKAQAQSAESEGSRKCRVHEAPEYPDLARQHGIKGVARVMVTVQPDGSVSEVKEVGGHPLLVESLTRAVKKWKYEKSDKTSVIEVKAAFGS